MALEKGKTKKCPKRVIYHKAQIGQKVPRRRVHPFLILGTFEVK